MDARARSTRLRADQSRVLCFTLSLAAACSSGTESTAPGASPHARARSTEEEAGSPSPASDAAAGSSSKGGNQNPSATLLTVGGGSACAATGGGLYCWGNDQAGPLGVDSVIVNPTPLLVKAVPENLIALSTSGYATCAVTAEGALKCWGGGANGEHGDGSSGAASNSPKPVQVTGLTQGVTAVSVGGGVCAIQDGQLFCWGRGSSMPSQVMGLSGRVVSVSVGTTSTCAVTDDGSVDCWGDNTSGKLGDGTTKASMVPVQVVGLTGAATSVSVGFDFACALMADAGVQCWGSNSSGQLAIDLKKYSSGPTAVAGLTAVKSISVGGSTACAVTGDGSAKCWGENKFGALGNGSTDSSSNVPAVVSGLDRGVSAIAMGGTSACAIASGAVMCWGYNNNGTLGNGSTANSSTPVNVIGL